mgnify:CR=1 FL=1
MFLGCLLSFIIFGGLAYFISKLALTSGFDRENRALAGLFYFLAPFLTLCILSLVIVGVYSTMGFSVSAMVEVIAQKANINSSGILVTLGSVLTAVFAFAAIGTGPATAFTASQASTAVAIVALIVKPDRELCEKWLPVVAGLCYGFCMWPFAAMLTFGL